MENTFCSSYLLKSVATRAKFHAGVMLILTKYFMHFAYNTPHPLSHALPPSTSHIPLPLPQPKKMNELSKRKSPILYFLEGQNLVSLSTVTETFPKLDLFFRLKV